MRVLLGRPSSQRGEKEKEGESAIGQTRGHVVLLSDGLSSRSHLYLRVELAQVLRRCWALRRPRALSLVPSRGRSTMCCDCRCLRLVNLTRSGYLSKRVGDSETRRLGAAQ